MIVISGALVLVALVLLVLGVTMQNLDFVYASIGVSLVSLIFLVIGILQRRGGSRAPSRPKPATTPEPVMQEPPARVPARSMAPVPAGAAREPAGVAAEQPVRGVPAKVGATGRGAPVPSGSVALLDEEEDEGNFVLIVAGRPRYHIDGCRYLSGKAAEELHVLDAREEGFSPCGVCRPDEALAAAAGIDDDAQGEDEDDIEDIQEAPAVAATSRRTATTRRVSEVEADDTAVFERPATSKPAGKPGASKPGASKPGASKPGASKPGASKPEASKPGASKPGASKPAPVKADSFLKSSPGVDSPTMSGPGTANARPGKPAVAAKPAVAGKPAVSGKPAVAGKPAVSGKPAVAGKPAVSGKPAVAGKTAVGKPIPGKTSTGKPAARRSESTDEAALSRTTAPARTTSPTRTTAPDRATAPDRTTEPPRRTPPVRPTAPPRFAAGTSVRSFPGAAPSRSSAGRPPAQSGPDSKIAAALAGTGKPGASKPAAPKADSFLAAAPGISSAPAKASPAQSRAASSAEAADETAGTARKPRSTAAGAPASSSRTRSVVVIPDRNRYHRDECRFVRDSSDAQTLTKAQATKQGYAPCGVCKP